MTGAAGEPGENGSGLRSSRWFAGHDVAGLVHRASVRATGISPAGLGDRPTVGICNPWSDLVSCNLHFRALAAAVRRGVAEAGGIPFEFPTLAVGENLMKPTSMLYRNLMAMDVEESIRAYPLDAVVLLAGCDKSIPAELMGAASAGVPAIMVTGGPCAPAHFRGRELGVGTDIWHYTDDVRAGRMTLDEYDQLEAAVDPVLRPLQRDGHRVDDVLPRRDARDDPPGDGDDPGRRRPAPARRGGLGPPRGRARDGGPAAGGGAHERGVRQRDHGADGARRLDERGRAPARARPARGHRPPARPLRRALAPHAGARERAPVRRVPVRASRPGGRGARAAPGAGAAPRPRRADGGGRHAGRPAHDAS